MNAAESFLSATTPCQASINPLKCVAISVIM